MSKQPAFAQAEASDTFLRFQTAWPPERGCSGSGINRRLMMQSDGGFPALPQNHFAQFTQSIAYPYEICYNECKAFIINGQNAIADMQIRDLLPAIGRL